MRYGVTVDMSRDVLMDRAVSHFEKIGLALVEQDACVARLEGNDGYVAICTEGSKQIELKIDTDTYGREAKQFIQRLGL